jgi:hypothetical protein
MKNLHILSILLLSLNFFACENADDEPKRGVEIFSVSPLEGQVRDTIIITGKNFKTINTNIVLFADDIVARVVSFSGTEIKALVPDSGAVSGPIKIRVGVYEMATSPQAFTIDKSKPVILSVTPSNISFDPEVGLAEGTEIVIKGANFAKAGNKVYFGTIPVGIVKESEYTIIAEIPPGLPAEVFELVVEKNNVRSVPVNFEVKHEAGLIFRDDFNRTNTDWVDRNTSPNPIGTSWLITGGNFQIKEHYLNTQYGGAALYWADDAIMNNGNGHSFKLSADFRIDVAVGTCFAGLIFNAQDANHYYVLRIGGDGLVQFLATADGGANWPGVFHSSTHSLPANTFCHAEVSSNTLGTFSVKITNLSGDVLFDQQLSDGEARYSGGYAGFWTMDDHSQFDNFFLQLK